MKKKSTTEIVIQAKILMKGVHLTIFKKKLFDRKFIFLMKKGIHMNPKKQKSICHRTTFYSIFNMSSYKIQNDLPKITKTK